MRLGEKAAKKFLPNHSYSFLIHKVVIFRAPDCSFAYLLEGGPPNIVRQGFSYRSYPTKMLTPLFVERLDPSWTCGRDQHPEVVERQQMSILAIGAGALGSPVISQLAKAGVGKLIILDNDYLSAANIGRHELGADSIGKSKSKVLSKNLGLRWPSCKFVAEHKTIQQWLKSNDLLDVDMIIDLTGEPEVRLCIDDARKEQNDCPLIIGWMEPYVAAAHACVLPKNSFWMIDSTDRLESLQAISWPNDVMLNEPSCSSVFQSYTSAAATHAVALITEAAIDLLDGKIQEPFVRHWVRGQKYLDSHRSDLCLRDWAQQAAPFDGLSLETVYE
ncbi:ThiF family adenylyltransferase [Leucothrix sargassi]|nr:ThiF family adenylyltransferase [Leucothrix sargassi]